MSRPHVASTGRAPIDEHCDESAPADAAGMPAAGTGVAHRGADRDRRTGNQEEKLMTTTASTTTQRPPKRPAPSNSAAI